MGITSPCLPAGAETEETCIIVVVVPIDNEPIVVALTDAVREVLEICFDQIEPSPRLGTRLKSEFITGMGRIDEQFLILLNVEKIFNGGDLAFDQDPGQPAEAALEVVM